MAHIADDDDRNPIEVIADEFVRRLRQGESPTVDEYAARHPDIAEEIHDLLPTVVAMEELKLQKEDSDRSRFLRGPGSLTRLGDFLILGEIGRGGMGIVYEAEQQSLGRHVAVKVLPRQSLLDEHRLARFEREAQTAARLHHTNIVPIFGVGEQDGYHYYVMQFIRGLGLDHVLRELRGESPRARPDGSGASLSGLAREAAQALRSGAFPEMEGSTERTDAPAPPPDAEDGPRPLRRGTRYWRSVARVGLQVADALNYAHSQGTLHRDIKPANLLLDAQGVVWVTDFGLAKAMEDTNITHSGDVVGTLQYMAPEQLSGDYDTRSDIYCLGLTLYELLTLQAAWSGTNRSGLIQKVSQGQVTTPRRIDATIPADLETIVLKTIAREPALRYQSAAELRDDLQRFLEDRPIRARRLNPIQRVSRWCRRNKALASAIGVAIVVTLAGTAYGWVSYVVQMEKTAQAENAIQKKDGAMRQLEENVDLSIEQFQKLFDALLGPDVFQTMIQEPGPTSSDTEAGTSDPATLTTGESETGDAATVQPSVRSVSASSTSAHDAELLLLVLQYYEKLASTNANQTGRRINVAPAYRNVGDIHLRLGDLKKAQAAYVRAILEYRKLGEARHAAEIAAVRIQLGQVYANRHLMDAAVQAWTEAWEALEVDGKPRHTAPEWKLELARVHDLLGSFTRGRRRPGPASDQIAHHQRAQELFDELLKLDPKNWAYRLGLARSYRNYALALSSRRFRRGSRTSVRLLERAETMLRALVKEEPNTPIYGFELAQTLRSSPGTSRLEEARKILMDLELRYPTVPAYREALAQVYIGQWRRRAPGQTPATLLDDLDKAIETLEGLAREFPDNLRYLRDVAEARMELFSPWLRSDPTGVTLLALIDEATAATEEMRRYLEGTTGPQREWLTLSKYYRELARVLNLAGRPVDAGVAMQEAQVCDRRAGVRIRAP